MRILKSGILKSGEVQGASFTSGHPGKLKEWPPKMMVLKRSIWWQLLRAGVSHPRPIPSTCQFGASSIHKSKVVNKQETVTTLTCGISE